MKVRKMQDYSRGQEGFELWLLDNDYDVEEFKYDYKLFDRFATLMITQRKPRQVIDDEYEPCDLGAEILEGEFTDAKKKQKEFDDLQLEFQDWLKRKNIIPRSQNHEMEYYYIFVKAKEEEHMWDIDMSDMD